MAFTAGAPVTCTVAQTAYPLSATNILMKTVKIQGKVGNAGYVSIGTSDMVVSTGVGTISQLPIPTTNINERFELTEVDSPNGVNSGAIYVASSNAGDIVIWGYDVQ